jgi:hypothetical protein
MTTEEYHKEAHERVDQMTQEYDFAQLLVR